MRRRTDPDRSNQRGAALIEYVLMLFVLFLSVTVGIQELDHGVKKNTEDTATNIAGDPYASTSTSSSTSIVGPTAPPGTVGFNQAPIVDVIDEWDVALGSTFNVNTKITDDKTPLKAMFIQASTWRHGSSPAPNLTGDLTTYRSNTQPGYDPKIWIMNTYTATHPGVFKLYVCANDGLVQSCDTGTIKVRSGTVHVDRTDGAQPYEWNATTGRSEWNAYTFFKVFEGSPHSSPHPANIYQFGSEYTLITVRATVTATYRDALGVERTKSTTGNCYVGAGNSGNNCLIWVTNIPGTAVKVSSAVVSVTGTCIDGWDGLNPPATFTVTGFPTPPTGPPPTTTPTTTPTTAPPTSGTGTPPSTGTSTTTTINDNT